mgnify:FL=1|jgi:gliding motility-associated lipoprotein GldH
MNNIQKIFSCGLSFLLMLLVGCGESSVYHDVKVVDEKGWHKDSIVSFEYDATDTMTTYDLIIDIRHSSDYSYKNFWLFVRSEAPDGKSYTDTLECVLADNYGNWIGKSTGSLYELPVMFMPTTKFPRTGKFRFDLYQGMRDDLLQGIHEMGFRIEKSKVE